MIQYFKAVNQASEGNIKGAINILQNSLNTYGDNIDVLYYIGDLIYHCGISIDKHPEESSEYFGRIMKYSDHYFEAEAHLSWIALREGNFEYVRNFLEKYNQLEGESTHPRKLFLFQGEIEIIKKIFSDPKSVIHPVYSSSIIRPNNFNNYTVSKESK